MYAPGDGMQVECYRRGNALSDLEQGLQDEDHLNQPTEDLPAVIQTLKQEKSILNDEIKA